MDSDYERSDLLSDPSVAYMTYADRKVMAQLDRRKWIPSSNSELTERQIGYLIGIRNIAHFVLMREIPHGTLTSPLTVQKELYEDIMRQMETTIDNI
jgi:hypothetical protein